VQEFWFCANCKSMNRATAKQCYSCHADKTATTMTTVTHGHSGAQLTPGLDDDNRDVARELMRRHTYVSAWAIGYFAAFLLAITATAVGIVLSADFYYMVSHKVANPIPGDDPRAAVVAVASVVIALIVLATVLVHSLFLALTTLDTAALGSGSARFGPLRAAVWWIEAWLWAIRAGLAFVGPPLLFLFALAMGGLLFGLIGGIIWFGCALWLLGDPISCLGKPARMLRDLHERLAVPGSSDSRIVTMWAAAFGTARGLDYAFAAGAFLLVIVLLFMQALGMSVGSGSAGSPGQAETATTLQTDTILAIQFAADVIALFLLARITFDLADRQRKREKWVLGGGTVPTAGHTGPTGGPLVSVEQPPVPPAAPVLQGQWAQSKPPTWWVRAQVPETPTAHDAAPMAPPPVPMAPPPPPRPAPMAPAPAPLAPPSWAVRQPQAWPGQPVQTPQPIQQVQPDQPGQPARPAAASEETQIIKPSSASIGRYGSPRLPAAPPPPDAAKPNE
jgi:hypothetical protein